MLIARSAIYASRARRAQLVTTGPVASPLKHELRGAKSDLLEEQRAVQDLLGVRLLLHDKVEELVTLVYPPCLRWSESDYNQIQAYDLPTHLDQWHLAASTLLKELRSAESFAQAQSAKRFDSSPSVPCIENEEKTRLLLRAKRGPFPLPSP